MQDRMPEVRIEEGRVITAPGVALVWLPLDGEVVAKIPPRKGNRRWLHESVRIRSPLLDDDRWYLPRTCLSRLVIAAVDRYGHVVVARDMAKLSRCTQSCLEATGMDCDCACMGLSHGSANTDNWVSAVGDVVFSNRGEFTRTAVVFGPQGSDLDAVVYSGELAGYPYRADRAGRYNEGWPTASQFMCAGCMSVRASVWDHCHTHSYVRAPLCGPCNTRHWRGWKPEHGRAPVSRNLDSSYYRWCPDYDAEWNSCTA
ncbi:endonuclease domain-containing protein [Nocardia farcinica]|uniref:endonuclease domain-containing protein n=2 Tax=Nocardia TaxID=1817 RepID=UPI0024537F35|nr:endonuclease domain-containing protein [Nocardia farcinica]